MKEYIEREAVKKVITQKVGARCGLYWHEAIEVIKKIPAADVAEVRHGRWTHHDDDGYEWDDCSECQTKPLLNGNEKPVLSFYCPTCGAKMDGGEK